MAAELVKVAVRCRPLSRREVALGHRAVVGVDSARGRCLVRNPAAPAEPPRQFSFDGAFGGEHSTEHIYNEIAYPLVEGVMEGYNGTIFAYGQTGSGKSFTMQGVADSSSQKGIIPRAFEHIFESVQCAENTKFLLRASYLEIYNEDIRDLLGADTKQKLELKEHPEQGVYVQGLSLHAVHSVAQCEQLMDAGCRNRAVAFTLMNKGSSRSHSIFTVCMEICALGAYLEALAGHGVCVATHHPTATLRPQMMGPCAITLFQPQMQSRKQVFHVKDERGQDHLRAAKLNLVDLAGSERQARTGATGERLKEATKINLSLSALGNVISALVDGRCRHIPYRDSKLTRLLQDSLGGNTRTLMVACVSPADDSYEESLSTLRYASRARNIRNKPCINEDPKDTLLREYQEEIKKLKAILAEQIGTSDLSGFLPAEAAHLGANPAPCLQPQADLEAEKQLIREEFQERLAQLQASYQAEQASRARLEKDISSLRDDFDLKVSVLQDLLRKEAADTRTRKISDHTPSYEDAVAAAHEEPTSAQDPAAPGTVTDTSGVSRGSAGAVGTVTAPGISLPADQQLVLTRLQVLQQQVVGGEQAQNQELKEKHKRRKKHADERRLQLLAALRESSEDSSEQALLDVYDSIQEEVRAKSKALEKVQEKLRAAEMEIKDLQLEFGLEKMDYLSTIRRQERELLLCQQLLDRVQSLVRRDCNYSNLERIRRESVWDEESGCWNIPEPVIQRTHLPAAVPALPQPKPGQTSPSNESREPAPEEDHYRLVLDRSDSETIASNYFRSRRASQILQLDQAPEGSEGAAGSTVPQARPFRLQSLALAPSADTKRRKSNASSSARRF